MKLSELKFKVITGTTERNEAIQKALFAKGVIWSSSQGVKRNLMYLAVNPKLVGGVDIKWFVHEIKAPEVTFEQALELIAQVEELKKEGRWVEFDIVNGYYTIQNGAKIRWQNFEELEKVGYIFGGWLWEYNDQDTWSIIRWGIHNKTTAWTTSCDDWSRPLIPTKIRFWIEE